MNTIVVSGASSGIGYETALKLAEMGKKVVAVSRNLIALTNLSKKSKNIIIYPIDLAKKDEIDKFSQWIGKNKLEINGLVNNAGSLINSPFSDLSDKDWLEMFNGNLLSAVHLCQSCIPFMPKRSHILNISSMSGFQGSVKFPGLSAYASIKGALSIFSECLAVELLDKNIFVNCLCLGAVETDMLKKAFPDYKAPLSAREMANFIVETLLNSHKVMNGKIIPVALSNP